MSIEINDKNNIALDWINNIQINQFRGIKNLKLNDLKRINLIVGDNNSGKTSILEAIHLLRSPDSFIEILKTTRLRDPKQLNTYEGFISFLSKDDGVIDIYANQDFVQVSLKILGDEQNILLDKKDLDGLNSLSNYNKQGKKIGIETKGFIGNLYSIVDNEYKKQAIKFTPYTKLMSIIESDKITINYLSPIDHISKDVFYNIISNENYKKICINLVRLFDDNIEDLLYMKNPVDGSAVEYVNDRKLGLRPLVSYGDGVKKVLAIANAIIESANGILLIDEIDTSIHYRHYNNIFNFIDMAAKQMQVQLFITTHSDEAINEILKIQNYDDYYNEEKESINVITLRRNSIGDISARSMSGFDVQKNKRIFNFEVRI